MFGEVCVEVRSEGQEIASIDVLRVAPGCGDRQVPANPFGEACDL